MADVVAAQARIAPFIHRTPVITSRALDAILGCRAYFKCENLQRAGAFKARGAHNAVFQLSESQARAGVVTHSSGNHGAALALAAHNRGIPATVVMPANAAEVKKSAVARYGARVVLCEPTLESRERATAQIIASSGAELVHPYDDVRVMAGQGTVALELIEQVPDLDVVLCPVGGGGLLSGVAVASKALRPAIRVIGAEPEQADDAHRSLRAGHRLPPGHPRTIADGLRGALSERTFAVIRTHADDILTVSEASIITAMRSAWEILKVLIEPSAAVPLALLMQHQTLAPGGQVGVVFSGGNVDLERLPWQS
jgi:threonine dehydratase